MPSRTRRQTRQARAHQIKELSPRLPPEIWREVFQYLSEEPKKWLASVSTICKTINPEVEAVLYRSVVIKKCVRVGAPFCRSVVRRPHRAVAVRELDIQVHGFASLVDPLTRALKVVTNLKTLTLIGDEPLLCILLDVPFQLQKLNLGCEESYTPDFVEDILARQPTIRELGLYFRMRTYGFLLCGNKTPAEKEDKFTLSRTDILPHLRILNVMVNFFPLSRITHAYNVTHLSFGKAHRDDVAHALQLFGGQLVALKITRCIDASCTDAYFWPTSVFSSTHRLPRLQYLEIQDDSEFDVDLYPVDITIPPKETFPSIKSFMWLPSVHKDVMDYLDHPDSDSDEDEDEDSPSLASYASALFKTWPTLENFALCDFFELGPRWLEAPGQPPEPGESIGVRDKTGVVSRGFKRDENGGIVGPVEMEYAQEGWRRYTSS
ncbi:hypothetical protein C8Q73DRAFT_789868 [Cubamyces lactineus]|nr:hypothetical protein C8Q73DRAFT_789868 [Cubamyces lactineus]